jgi:Outer membrane protein beta-barrel domain
MKKTILTVLAFLCASIAASGQQSGSYAYVFGGPVIVPKSAFTRWNGDFIHAGAGGEARFTDSFGLGAEAGVLTPVTNQYALTTGLVSVTPAYHFVPRKSNRKTDPFVDGGFSLVLGIGAGGGGAAAFHYGGGVNYWFSRRMGLRLEFRHHIWTPEAGEAINLVGFRVGLTFR